MNGSCTDNTTNFSYSVYSFTPSQEEKGFYEKSFEDKLVTVVSVIEEAAKSDFSPTKALNQRSLFVAPEYLFSNSYEFSHESYYSEEQKNKFKTTMQELSKRIDMIIVPGTFRWCNEQKNGSKVYRNNAYFFYQGDVQHYNKHDPHPSYDYPHTFEHEEFFSGCASRGRNVKNYRINHFKSKNSNFFGEPQSSIVKIAGLKIGIEICADTLSKTLLKSLKDKNVEEHPNIHLLLSDGIKGGKANFYAGEGVVSVHVDRSFSTDPLYRDERKRARAEASINWSSINLKNLPSIIQPRHYNYSGSGEEIAFVDNSIPDFNP